MSRREPIRSRNELRDALRALACRWDPMGIGWDPHNPLPADEYDNFVDLVSLCLDHRISFADTKARVQTMMKRYDVEDAIGLDRFLRAAFELRADDPRSDLSQ